jgi:hypothetical protein
MVEKNSLQSLPRNFEMGLLLLERGYYLCHGGKVPASKLPEKVAHFLNRLEEEGVDWVLVGAEAINLYRKSPRATVDVDIVVRSKHIPRARKVLKETCLEIKDTEVNLKGTLSPSPLELTVDVIKSQSHPLFEEALDRQVLVEGVRAPRIEALLALKFLSAVSPWRSPQDKHQDVADFINVFKDNRSSIDRPLLLSLGSRAHASAAEEFARFLDAVENDKPITI